MIRRSWSQRFGATTSVMSVCAASVLRNVAFVENGGFSRQAQSKDAACSVHTLAELFAVLTALPVKPPISPEHAMLFVNEIRARVSPISLDSEDYYQTLRAVADRGLSGGRIYDALLLRCAKKCNPQTICTWNLRHFEAIAPELATRLRRP